MDIEKLFNGIAVIIDNEIEKKDSSIFAIKEVIESRNIPVATYMDIPNIEVVASLSNASFIILDWDYFNSTFDDEELKIDRIMKPTTLTEDKEDELIRFITEITNKIFVPVFIFTAINSESIKDKLRMNNLWDEQKPNRIFVKQKSEVSSDEELFAEIKNWLIEMPSAYVLKVWDKSFADSKNKLFLEMYGYSPNWVKIIWEMLKEDSIDNQHEFGEFVTRNLVNRLQEYSFCEEYLETDKSISQEELSAVIESERYITYSDQPEQAYTGDLFKKGNKYYLNIRAQCDLARPDHSGNYDPILYCIMGKRLRSKDITTEDIQLTKEKKLVFGKDKDFSLEELGEICTLDAKLGEFNKNFRKHRNGVFFSRGEVLEKKPEVIVACVAGEKIIKFELDLVPMKFSELICDRKGRLLSPYINRIQQKCAQYIVREGVMPIPRDLFSNFED